MFPRGSGGENPEVPSLLVKNTTAGCSDRLLIRELRRLPWPMGKNDGEEEKRRRGECDLSVIGPMRYIVVQFDKLVRMGSSVKSREV